MSLIEDPIAPATAISPGTWAPLPSDQDMLNIMEPLVLTLDGAATPTNDMTWVYRGLPRHVVLSTTDGKQWRDNPIGNKPVNGKHAGASRPGRLYASGGGSGFGNGVWSSDNGRDWQTETAFVRWTARRGHCMAWFLNRLWVFGGELPNSHPTADVWSWGEGEPEWNWEADNAFAPRLGAAAVVFGNRLWMFGGSDSSTAVSYTENGKDWVDRGPRFDFRLFPQAQVVGEAVYVLGGWRSSTDVSTDVLCSQDGERWTSVQGPGSPWKNGRGFGCAVLGDGADADAGIVVFGGRDNTNKGSADVLKFTPAPLPPA